MVFFSLLCLIVFAKENLAQRCFSLVQFKSNCSLGFYCGDLLSLRLM